MAEDNSAVAGISGIAGITLPTGDFLEQNFIEYTVKENGVFVFKATDNAGNESTETVVIDYIRPVLPNDWENNMPVINAVLHAVGKHNIANIEYSDLLNLRYLDLSAKGLESLPDILGYGQNIVRLDLRGNEFVAIPECVFRLKSLSSLDLSNNNLISVNERIAELGALDYLDVSLNYLVDYDCPIVVDTYRNIGNFTYTNRAEQYSFEFAPHDYGKEYIGNTVQMNVNWRCGNNELQEPLEDHRKALYRKYYGEYKTYRPLIYAYNTSIGELKVQTPDYARIYLPEYGIMKIGLTIGAENNMFPASLMNTQSNNGGLYDMLPIPAFYSSNLYPLASLAKNSLNNIEVLSDSVEVFALPAPEIQEIDVTRGVIVVDAGMIDENIRTDLKAIVEILDEHGTVLAMSEAKVPDVCNVRQ